MQKILRSVVQVDWIDKMPFESARHFIPDFCLARWMTVWTSGDGLYVI